MAEEPILYRRGQNKLKLGRKIKGALRRKWLYIGRIQGQEVTAEDIKDYILEFVDNTSIEVKKLEIKGPNSAFSVGVPDNIISSVASGEAWPEGIVIREFNFRNFFRHKNREPSD